MRRSYPDFANYERLFLRSIEATATMPFTPGLLLPFIMYGLLES